MNDSITFFIALGVIFLVLRWLLGQGGNEQARANPNRQQRRLHVVRLEHVQTIQSMFPDIPEAAIRADLARTGSPVITSDNILRNGGTLPVPLETARADQPAERSETPIAGANVAGARHGTGAAAAAAAASSGVSLNAAQSPLVNRLRISKNSDTEPLPPAPPKVWESDADKRADVLRKRKEFMLMEARKKFLEKQNKKAADNASESVNASSHAAGDAAAVAASSLSSH
ncbi:hypothetical protein GQ54DRAFT_299737 [Martensiomyces pterosporus]|nr:hypothetical protein GQ54DRAFT_299737 [Martensiomyces pterosporus]